MELEQIVFTEKEAAKYINMSLSFLRNSRVHGTKPNMAPAPKFYKVGRSVRYLKIELDNYLRSFQQYQNLTKVDENTSNNHSI